MAKFYAVVIFLFLITECCLFIDSKKSHKSSRFLHKPTGRVDTGRQQENPNERKSFLSSSRANSQQINVGSIENEIVKAAKSSTDGFGADDEDSAKGKDSSGGGHERDINSFDSVVESFDASVKRLKRKLLRSGGFTLYSSDQKGEGNAPQENKTTSPSVATESSTKSVLRSTAIDETAISSTQAIVSSSASDLAILPTQASGVIQETAGDLKSVGAVSMEARITPSSTAKAFTSYGNILPTEALASSPVLEAVSSSTDKNLQPFTSAPVPHRSTAIAEEKPTSGISIPTTAVQTENTAVLVTELPEGSSQPTTKELIPSETTKPTDVGTEVKGKKKGDPPKKKEKGLFRNLSIEILIALVAGALCALLLVAFLVYRLKKRNEGSYALSESINMKVRTHDDLGMKKEVFV